jgi:hypothetical protein
MESETPKSKKPSRQGIAMIVVLSMIVVFTMLGYMGIELAGRDTRLSGTYLDIVSRDLANRSALELGLARLNADAARTGQQLQLFVADSSKPLASTHRFLNLAFPTCSLQVDDPGFHPLGTGGDLSAVKVQVVSVDLGSTTTGSSSGEGIKLTLLVTGRGRNGDLTSSISSYQVQGLDVPAGSGGTPTLNYAIYINGNISNSNVGSRVAGNMYVSGDVSLNGPASIEVTGAMRIGGSMTSNAPITVGGNAVIGGDIYSNGSAAMNFQKNLVVKGAFQTLNAPITVAGNLEVQSVPAYYGPWGSSANLTVGSQLWMKKFCYEIKAKVKVSGNAFFDSCIHLNTSGITDTFTNLYLKRGGGASENTFFNGTVNVLGNLGSWANSGAFWVNSATVNVTGGLLVKQPLDLDNRLVATGAIQLHAGISDIGNGAANALYGGTSLYLKATGQRGDFNGGVTINGPITSKGTLDGNFSNNAGNSRWTIVSTAGNRAWLYENASAFNSGNAPRVANATTTNATGWRATNSIATPADLFTAPAPLEATSYAPDPYSAEDIDLSSNKGWNQVYTVDSAKLKPLWTDLTDAAIAAAGAQGGNWTIADWNKIYNKYKRADGWLIARFPNSGCNMGGINPAGGTFTGKAIWIVERSINVGGNWPGSTSANDIQMIYVRGPSGQLNAFGTQTNLTGYVHFENPFNGQMKWGANVTLTGAMHLKGISSSLTGNSGSLQVVGSQAVFDQIQVAVPGLFGLPSPGSAAATPVFSTSSGSTNKIVVRQPVLFFNPWGFYR